MLKLKTLKSQSAVHAEEIMLQRMVAHEMRNNLDLIKQGATNLRNNSSDEYLNSLQMIDNATSTLWELFNVLQSGYFHHSHRRIDLSELILEQLMVLEYAAKEQGIAVDFKFYDEEISIYGDSGQIGRSLFNLVKNALDACGAGDSVTLETWQSTHSAYVKIADTGKGMDSETLHYMWKPFFTTKQESQGNHGLGTYIARKTILNHKGSIYAESRIAQGTIIHISLPLMNSNIAA